ncbi:MAG TPA: hypothetical protein VG819_05355 [Rhizomicrobium sp.]|nr:hypothetical protein [Rhizomicrobium sp.]
MVRFRCRLGGTCQFTIVHGGDLLCAKCRGRALDAILQSEDEGDAFRRRLDEDGDPGPEER